MKHWLLKHHVVKPTYIQFLFLKHTSTNLGRGSNIHFCAKCREVANITCLGSVPEEPTC